MKIVFWVFNILFALSFTFSVVVQYNDPDPLRWMAIYSAALVACFVSPRATGAPVFLGALFVIATVWSGTLIAAVPQIHLGQLFEHWEMKSVLVEEARESLGLAIVAFWTLILLVRLWWFRRPVDDLYHAD